MSPENDQPFADLPAGLVEEVLDQTEGVGSKLIESFSDLKEKRESFRDDLRNNGILQRDSDYGYPPIPTSCGTDGSYGIERLLSVDLTAAAAVAVEGLTPPREERKWEDPHHKTVVEAEPHKAETATILRSLMLGNELSLAIEAPHEVTFIDGTLTLPIIYFNQALNKAPQVPDLNCSSSFLERCDEFLECYSTILSSRRTDKQYVGIPKYSTRTEIGDALGWDSSYDDRGVLTQVLSAGELTRPLRLQQPSQEWHFNLDRLTPELKKRCEEAAQSITSSLPNVHVTYFKPHNWMPAIRVEVPANIATNKQRLSVVLRAIKHQCATPSILEPFPTYMADRMVKALSGALPAFRHVATQNVARDYQGDIGEVFLAMHGYRSESGGASHG